MLTKTISASATASMWIAGIETFWRTRTTRTWTTSPSKAGSRQTPTNSRKRPPTRGRVLPPHEHAALAEEHARDVLLARGAENAYNMHARQMARELMGARTTKDMLCATYSMAESARWHVDGLRCSPKARIAHADYARLAHADYARNLASAALDNPDLKDNRSELANHRNNPLAQRGARWHAVNDELLRD